MSFKTAFLSVNRSLLAPKNIEFELFSTEKGNIAIKKQTISSLLDFKIKIDSKMTGEKKLIIAKICTYEKLTNNIQKLYLNKIPWFLSIAY